MTDKIDFVMVWVDDSDPEWIADKAKYSPEEQKNADSRNIRYQDWDNLQYWFRGVEKFAPWVNKIHFITCGHLPKWLNTEHPKLNIVKHSDYIPKEYLPTFSSHVIEINLHRLDSLGENFVYFNDDTFLTAPVKPEDFFKNSLPCDSYRSNAVVPLDDKFSAILFNNVQTVNRYYHKRELLKKNFKKWFSVKNGIVNNLLNFALLPWRDFTGFYDPHLPNSFKKSEFKNIYELEKEAFDATSSHRFRSESDINQYLIRYSHLASGEFTPRKASFGKNFIITDDNTELLNAITKSKYHMICCNDTGKYSDFEKSKAELKQALDKLLPQKSSFEK